MAPIPKPKVDVAPPDPVVPPPVSAQSASPRRKLGHEVSPEAQKLEDEAKKPESQLDPTIGLDAEVEVDDTEVEDDDADDLLAPEDQPFEWSISKRDPRIVFVPATATRERIGKELDSPYDLFVVVGAMEAMPPSDQVQGIRFIHGSRVPPAVLTEMQKEFDAALPIDEEATLDALVAESGGWTAAQYFLRWSQYATYKDASGDDYFDDFIEALEARTITTTHTFSADSKRNGLEELLDQTSRDVHIAVQRARARSTKHAESGDTKYQDSQPFDLGHVVGRYITGTDTAGVAAQAAQVLFGPVGSAVEAEIRLHNASFPGGKVSVCTRSGWWGYGLVFDTDSPNVGTLLPPVVGSPSENGRFYWYYPSVMFVGAAEQDPNGPMEGLEYIEQEILDSALADGNPGSLVSLDFGALRLAKLEDRVRIFTIVVNLGIDNLEMYGYRVQDVADSLARVVMTMPPGELQQFTHELDKAGILAKLINSHDPRLLPLGQAFTFQSLASTEYGPEAFSDPTTLTQGSDDPDSYLDYYQATAQDPATDEDTTTISFEHGRSSTVWGDTSPWSRRSRETTRSFGPTELLTIDSVSKSGKSSRIVSAFEAALTQGDPEGQVDSKVMWSFFDTVMLLQGGAALLRLGQMGLRAAATASLRAALEVAAEELGSQGGKAALRTAVDFALYNATRYAQANEEELQKTPEGRAFLSILTAATVMLAARDIGALIESGAIPKLLAAGRAALGVVTGSAAAAVAKAVEMFESAGIAWARLEEEGALLVTNVGGVAIRQPRSVAEYVAAFRVAQAQVAGERLLGGLAAGSAEHTRAAEVLGALETEAGGFKRAAGAATPTEGELAAARAYKNVAAYARGLSAADQEKLLAAIKKLLDGRGSRSIAELSPFITAGVRAVKKGVDAEAYFAAVAALAGKGISREGLARLAANAGGRNPVDLVWLSTRDLTDADLDFLVRDKRTQWAKYVKASGAAATDGEKIQAEIAIRGAAGEITAGEQAEQLVPGFRVEGRQVPAGTSEVDYQLISTDGLGRRRPMEVKAQNTKAWGEAFKGFAPDHKNPTATLLDNQRGVDLADPTLNGGKKMVEKMLDQLNNAVGVASRDEKVVLAVSSSMTGPQRNVLARILKDNGLGNKVEVVFMSESKIQATGRRLGEGLGWR